MRLPWVLGLHRNPATASTTFVLLDHQGHAHKLYYLSDASAVVLMAHSATCPDFVDYQVTVRQRRRKRTETATWPS